MYYTFQWNITIYCTGIIISGFIPVGEDNQQKVGGQVQVLSVQEGVAPGTSYSG